MRVFWRWLRNIAIAIDQLGNALTFGDPDETVSSRLGKAAHRSRAAWFICRLLSLIDNRHCEDAEEIDEGGNRA